MSNDNVGIDSVHFGLAEVLWINFARAVTTLVEPVNAAVMSLVVVQDVVFVVPEVEVVAAEPLIKMVALMLTEAAHLPTALAFR